MPGPMFLAVGWTLLLLIGCFLPGELLPFQDVASRLQGFYFDKVVHLVLFFGFAYLWSRALPKRGFLLGIVVIGCLFAVGTELIQGALISSRGADVMDTMADLVGLAVGLALALALSWKGESVRMPA